LSLRKFWHALMAPVVFASVLIAQTNPDNPKFSLTIKAFKSEVALGSEIGIAITIANISDDYIALDFGHYGRMPRGYEFDIRDEQGKPVARYGKRYLQLQDGNTLQYPSELPGSVLKAGIEPGKSIEQGAMLSEVYPFDHPGKYTIQVSRPATLGTPGKPELNRVYSNTITVTVLPATPAAAPE
jgi:hypothetical protein